VITALIFATGSSSRIISTDCIKSYLENASIAYFEYSKAFIQS